MTARSWLALCCCFLVFGALIGWAARATTTGDRYVRSLAERHEATTQFYNERTDQLIHTDQPKPKGVPNVKK